MKHGAAKQKKSGSTNVRSSGSVCVICHKKYSDNNLSVLKDFDSWATLVNATCIRNHAHILNVAKVTPDGNAPNEVVQYHRKCRSLFTLK